MSPLLQDVLNLLTQTVVCIRLVFLHDYYLLRETLAYFVKHARILDLHTVWQPQRSSLPSKYPVEILSLLAGLQVSFVFIEPFSLVVGLLWSGCFLWNVEVSGPTIPTGCRNHVLSYPRQSGHQQTQA